MIAKTLSSKDMILAIPYHPNVARSLMNKGKNYDLLIQELLKYDPFTEENQHLTTSKELQATLKISSSKLRKMLEKVYDDFLSSMEGPGTTLIMGSILVEFYVRFYDKRASFCAMLDHIPKVGDDMELDFLRPIFNFHHFYVQRVTHNLENDKHAITVWLKAGNFNLYEHLELERAKSEQRYDWKTDTITHPAEPIHQYVPPRGNYRGWR